MTPFVFDTTLTPGALSATVYTPTSGEWLGLIFSAYVTELRAPFRQIIASRWRHGTSARALASGKSPR